MTAAAAASMGIDASNIDLDYVLYTDCDVLFMSDVNTCTAPPKPPVMYVGGESGMNQIANTGEEKIDGGQRWGCMSADHVPVFICASIHSIRLYCWYEAGIILLGT